MLSAQSRVLCENDFFFLLNIEQTEICASIRPRRSPALEPAPWHLRRKVKSTLGVARYSSATEMPAAISSTYVCPLKLSLVRGANLDIFRSHFHRETFGSIPPPLLRHLIGTIQTRTK